MLQALYFMYNGERFSLPKKKKQKPKKKSARVFSFHFGRSLEEDKEGHEHFVLQMLVWASWKRGIQLAGERKLCSSGRWLMRQALLAVVDDYCIVRTIIVVNNVWITSRVDTWPTNLGWIISCKQICKTVCLHNMSSYFRAKFGEIFFLLRWKVMVAMDFRSKRKL